MTSGKKSKGVGYKNPPTRTQFQPGQSGNPNGRPKTIPSFKADLRAELSELILIRESGLHLSVSKQRAFIRKLVSAAIAGEPRASIALMSLCSRFSNDEANGDFESRPSLSAEDVAISRRFADRQKKRHARDAADKEGNK